LEQRQAWADAAHAQHQAPQGRPLDIAIIGSGIAGLSCAWLLHPRHRVTVYEAAPAIGGHVCTVDVQPWPNRSCAVDMGFIVYNERTYPNLTALFRHLNVATQESCMSLGLSLDGGGLEYGGHDLRALFAQKRNLLRPRFWSLLRQLRRLYGLAASQTVPDALSLGEWLDRHRFPDSFRRDHLLPMAAAIWSCPAGEILHQPAASFFRFCDNHGLLRLRDRPEWRTITGGSREYVKALTAGFAGRIRTNSPVAALHRAPGHVEIRLADGATAQHDHAVLATHGDQALALLADPDARERQTLGAFRTAPNLAVLHGDDTLMPRRHAVWSSWNYLAPSNAADLPCVTYWMNRLQSLPGPDLFVTLNPTRDPPSGLVHATRQFRHPVFDAASLRAQRDIWHLQGARRTWFCGAYLGAGFHEDGIQSGLAVAEALGQLRRPWNVSDESARIHLPTVTAPFAQAA
jgi:predicted NAD/FAD-binding protein